MNPTTTGNSLLAILVFALTVSLLSPCSAASVAPTLELSAPVEAEITPYYVTADTSGSHVLSPSSTAFGINHVGVADLIINTTAGTFRCTGTILPGGTSIVTAAHCVTDNSGVKNVNTVTAFWQTPTGNLNAAVGSSGVTVHPSYDGDLANGNDIAVITFGSELNTALPRYDIYRGDDETQLGVDYVKVGYGRSGHGNTGDVLASGTKRAGLNSYDVDGSAAVQALFPSSTPPPGGILMYDFDNGLVANDVLDTLFTISFADLGAGDDEVVAAPGDSGGPTFIIANDTRLTLNTSSIDLGTVIGSGNLATQNLTLTIDGNNSTSFDILYSGDATNSSTTGNHVGDVQDAKIAGITSGGLGFNTNPPDVTPGVTDSSFGEIAIDTAVSAFQDFLDPFIDPGFQPLATQIISIDVDDSAAGSKTATVTIDNLATTSEFDDVGSNDANDIANVTATVLDHSEASFDQNVDLDTIILDFGTVGLGENVSDLAFRIFNLEDTVGFTAGLDLDSVIASGDTGVLTTDLSAFSNLFAGSSNLFSASFDTSQSGFFSASYLLQVSDENLTGAQAGTSLLLQLNGTVAIPEPSTLWIFALGLGLMMVHRVRRKRVARQTQ